MAKGPPVQRGCRHNNTPSQHKKHDNNSNSLCAAQPNLLHVNIAHRSLAVSQHTLIGCSSSVNWLPSPTLCAAPAGHDHRCYATGGQEHAA
jgi:hypothetical protein